MEKLPAWTIIRKWLLKGDDSSSDDIHHNTKTPSAMLTSLFKARESGREVLASTQPVGFHTILPMVQEDNRSPSPVAQESKTGTAGFLMVNPPW